MLTLLLMETNEVLLEPVVFCLLRIMSLNSLMRLIVQNYCEKLHKILAVTYYPTKFIHVLLQTNMIRITNHGS